MIGRELGGFRSGKPIARGRAAAKLGQKQQLYPHMVYVLPILVA